VPPTPGWTARLIARQQELNVSALAELREWGLSETSEVLLDFSFVAPTRRAAQHLADLLGKQTDYAAEVSRTARRGLRARRWQVTGQTQEMLLSPEGLDDWVRWMVVTGASAAGCRFTGWGTFAPGG
jgi:hypothetical protein